MHLWMICLHLFVEEEKQHFSVHSGHNILLPFMTAQNVEEFRVGGGILMQPNILLNLRFYLSLSTAVLSLHSLSGYRSKNSKTEECCKWS